MNINGKFEIISGKIVISDPCYTRDTWCIGVIDNVKNGKWNFTANQIDSCGRRIQNIEAYHSGSSVKNYKYIEDLGVDSGQLGIFDDSIYPHGEDMGEYDDKTSFYGKCCEITLSKDAVGSVDNLGVVSSSGYGDGNYEAVLGLDVEGQVVKIEICFIIDEEEIDEEEIDEEEID